MQNPKLLLVLVLFWVSFGNSALVELTPLRNLANGSEENSVSENGKAEGKIFGEVLTKGDSREVDGIGTGRNPRFLFNFGNSNGTTGGNMIIPMPGFGGTGFDPSGSGNLIGTLGTTAILLKGGLLGALTALKAAILPPIFLAVLIAFLIAGAAFFTCSVIDCGSIFGGFGGLGGGGFGPGGFGSGLPFSNSPLGTIFNRNSYDYYEQQQRPVYQALENSYKKYGEDEMGLAART